MLEPLVLFRGEIGLTTEEMAKPIGVSKSFYEKIEGGQRNPSYGFISKFKEAFPDAENEIFFNNNLHATCKTG